MKHPWDSIRETPTVYEPGSITAAGGVHESVLRSFQILHEVKRMLAAGDSPETIRRFIDWAESEERT